MPEPYDLIRHAIEFYAGNPTFFFAATNRCAALLVFNSLEDRVATISHFPAKFAGINITLLRPEETDNRATTRYDHLIEIEAKNYPLELWHPQGANFVDHVTPDGCILRLPPAQVVDVKLQVVKTWAVFEDFTAPLDGDDVNGDDRGQHVHGAWRWNCPRGGPCPGSHASDSMPPPSPRGGLPPTPPAQAAQAPIDLLQPLVGGPLLPLAAAAVDTPSRSGLSGGTEEEDHETLSPTVVVSNSFSSVPLDGGDSSQLSVHCYFLWVITSSIYVVGTSEG
ncbi:hypothetical protein VPH35_126016 [Triticum aestivum]